MKVLYGTMEIANQMATLSHEMRQRGVPAACVNYYPNYLGYRPDFEYDVRRMPPDRRARELARFALGALQEFDTFHFFFATSLTLDGSDLPLLRSLGSRVIMQHCGSDVRVLSKALEYNKWAVSKPIPPEQIHGRLTHLSQYIDECLVTCVQNSEFVKPYYRKVHMVPAALRLDEFPVADEHRVNPRPLVVHAPTNRHFKGTDDILRALTALSSRYDFDVKLVEGMSHEEAKAIYRRADVIVDQIRAGNYGGFSIEAMALGKPVVVFLSEYSKRTYPEPVPVISADPETIERQLEIAIADAGLRHDLGLRARAYVERYHDARRVASTVRRIYRGDGIDDRQFQMWWHHDPID